MSCQDFPWPQRVKLKHIIDMTKKQLKKIPFKTFEDCCVTMSDGSHWRVPAKVTNNIYRHLYFRNGKKCKMCGQYVVSVWDFIKFVRSFKKPEQAFSEIRNIGKMHIGGCMNLYKWILQTYEIEE